MRASLRWPCGTWDIPASPRLARLFFSANHANYAQAAFRSFLRNGVDSLASYPVFQGWSVFGVLFGAFWGEFGTTRLAAGHGLSKREEFRIGQRFGNLRECKGNLLILGRILPQKLVELSEGYRSRNKSLFRLIIEKSQTQVLNQD